MSESLDLEPILRRLPDVPREQMSQHEEDRADLLAEVGRLRFALTARDVRIAGLGEAIEDTCWKATRYGQTEDGDTAVYIVPKGTMHRLIGAAQSAGIPATFRSHDPRRARDAEDE